MFKKKNAIWWIVLVLGLVAVNLIASQIHSRYDLTQERRYSLTTTTKNLVRQLDDEMFINVYLKGDFPTEFRKLSTATQEFLSVLKESNPSKISYRFIDPQDEALNGKTWSDSLRQLGVDPINITVQVKAGQENKLVFPYAIINYKGEQSLVNLFQSSKRNLSGSELNNAEAMMEYQFASKIDQVLYPGKPLIAYSVGNGEPAGAEVFALRHAIDPESINYSMLPDEAKQRFPPS